MNPLPRRRSSVLMVAFVFPPIGGSGVQRTTKFVKYLPDFGWQPTVVCCEDGSHFGLAFDHTLLADVPAEARVLRTPFVSPYGLRRRLKRLVGMSQDDGREPSAMAQGGTGLGSGQRSAARDLLKRMGGVLRPMELPPIDGSLYWGLSVVRVCLRVIKKEKVDVIYTSSDPYSDHIVGWLLKRLTGKPWVADFRDPWTQAWNYGNRGWRRRLDLLAERWVLLEADRVIGVTPSETEELKALAPSKDPACFRTIENGFDEEDFLNAPCSVPDRLVGPGGRTLISFVGVAYEGNLVPMLAALERLGQAGRRLKLRIVGGLARQELDWLRDHAMDVQVEVVERVPHPEAIAHMRCSDALLLAFGNGPQWAGVYSGKLFEYMAAGPPILLSGPEGDASRVIEATGTGVRLPLEQPDQATAMLSQLAEDPSGFWAQHYHPDRQAVARFDRRALTGRLAALFDELVGQKGCR